jgi:hypothetical protein
MKNASEHPDPTLDNLIDALLDATLTGPALADLAARVAQEDDAYERFENAMQAQRLLSSGMAALADTAQGVNVPIQTVRVRAGSRVRTTILRRAGAIAAVLSLVASSWVVSGRLSQRDVLDSAATTPDALTAQSAFANYMRVGMNEGRIIRELPPVTIELKKTDSGADVVFVRRLLERARVDDVYRVGQDETGRPVAVPMDLAALTPGQSL